AAAQRSRDVDETVPSLLLVMPAAHIDEVSSHCRGGGCGWAHEMGAPFAALAPFEVPVAGGGAALLGRENVRVHAQAHRASRLAPLGTSLDENAIQPLALGLMLHAFRARHHQGSYAGMDLVAVQHFRRGPQVF